MTKQGLLPLFFVLPWLGCAGADDGPGAGGSGGTATAGASGTDGALDSGGAAGQGGQEATGGSSGSGGGNLPADCGQREGGGNPWIAANFASAPVLTGNFNARTSVELPRLVRDATASNAKYAFDLKEAQAPDDPRVAFVNVRITNLKSADAFGAGIQTSGAPGARLFLSHVYIEPNWPTWKDYQTTNYDGIVLDGAEEIYAEDLTIKNWNADSAMDIKAKRAQFVCLRTEGNGNRTLRFWQPGPHYLVKSSVNNATGAVIWISDCTATTLNVYDSTFNGSPQIPAAKISCDRGATPRIVYADQDPRTTGEMHAMFSGR